MNKKSTIEALKGQAFCDWKNGYLATDEFITINAYWQNALYEV